MRYRQRLWVKWPAMLALLGGATGAWAAACSNVATGNWTAAATWAAPCNVAGGPTAADTVTIINGTTVTVNAAGLAANSVTIAAGNATTTLTFAAGSSLAVTNNVVINAPTANNRSKRITVLTGALTVGGNVTLTGGTTNTRDALLSASTGNITINGGLIINSTVATSSAVQLTGAGTVTVNGAAGVANGDSVIIGTGTFSVTNAAAPFINSSATNAVTTTLSTGTLNVAGNLTNAAAETITVSSTGNINVGGNWSNSGTFNQGTGTVTFNGGGAQTINGAAATTFNNLVVANTAAAVSATTNFNTNGTLTVNANAVLSPAAAVVVGGTGTLTGAGTVQVTRTAAVADFASQYTIATKTLANLTVDFAGVGTAQTVDMLTYGSATGGGLKVSNASGVSLTANTTVAGTLTLTSGLVDTGANTLEVSSSCATGISGGGAGSFVLGNLGLHYPVNAGVTTCTFPVGDAASYTPLTVAMTNVTSTLANSLLTARTDAGDHADTTAGTSGIDAAKSVNRNWTLTPGGLLTFTSYDVTFTFPAGDVDGGAATANFIVGRKSGAEWTYPTVGAAGATSTQATGITQTGGFGAFAIGEAKLAAGSILSEWRMDESSWNGTASEVGDSQPASHHGTAASLSATKPTTAGAAPAIAGDPGTCRYGTFTRANKDYVALPAAFPNLGTQGFTVTAWIRTSDNTQSGQRVFADDENNTQGYGFSLGDGGAGTLRFFSRGTPSALILDTGNVIANNAWYFVAAVADVPNRRKRIYVYDTAGTLLANVSATWTEASFGSDAGIASIGGETNGAAGENTNAFGFSGDLDEVRVYQSALSASHANLVRQATHACPPPPLDHISIEHASGQGVTCTPSTLTIKACMDAACSSFYTGGVAGTLTATGTPTVNWVGGAGFSIPVGGGSTTKDVQVTTPGSVVFGTSGVAPAPAAATTCNFGAPSCTFTSSDSGLLFDVPHHVSEVSQNITVSAVKKADNSLACVPAFGSVSKNVAFTCSYSNPASGTLPVRVGGQALNAGNNPAAACDGAGQTLSLAFDASGVASTTVQYADVGSLTLNAQYTGSGADAGLVMTGADAFIAAPASFAFSAITAAPIKAGTSFGATVTAKNNAGGTTPNFGQESPAESVTLTHIRYQPAGIGASDGTFSGSTGAFSAGAATASNLIWSEVGTIDLTATLASGNYLSSGVAAAAGSTGATGAVGPFVPDHFETIVTQGCSAGGFSYSGQPFDVQIKAMNGALTPAVTVNYDGSANTTPNFAKAVTLSDGNAAGAGTLAPTAVAASAFAAGVATATPAYTFTTRQTVETTIKLRAADADAGSSGFTEGTTAVRSGRARLGNAHGSELLNLSMPFRTEYWTSSGWVLHSSDSCTGDATLGAGNAVSVTLSASPVTCVQDNGNPGRSGSGCAAAGPAAQRFKEGATPGIGFAGDFNLWLKAPGAGNTGAVTVTGNMPAWLQYPWGGGADVNPAGRATFGVYKGADEFIYMRESY